MADRAAILAADIRGKLGSGEASTSSLHVDDRVLARVTDGIYRTPASAFRELISNAYDADATLVVIQSDAPRFERIVIRDNGNGMSPETIADLVNHIGGSSKRTAKGKRLQTVSARDPNLSIGGRRLIGKIGIGLFSVSQLTQHFQVITKRAGDSFRTSAEIILKTHTEENPEAAATEDFQFETGEVAITTEAADDIDTQGTEIILMDLRSQARDLLQGRDRWAAIATADPEDGPPPLPPTYHIGQVLEGEPDTYELEPSLPWTAADVPEQRFRKLYQAIQQEVRERGATPNIEDSLDSYLGMLWRLSLAVPVPYIDKHPFDLTGDDGIGFYKLSNGRGGAEEVQLADGETIGSRLGLQSTADPVGGFEVVIDDVSLLRPIAFDRELHGTSGIGKPLMFFGKVDSGLDRVPATVGGGGLSFDAYFYWNQKIMPKENNGCLIRINNSSGVLFDQSFLGYQVSELTRLRQLMSEIFIVEGLDAALNIDRESFNYSHPHYQFLQEWVHFAVRQTTNKLKGLNKEVLENRRATATASRTSALGDHAERVWRSRRGADADPPPDVRIVPKGQRELALPERSRGTVVVDEEAMATSFRGRLDGVAPAQVAALVQVLSAYGLLDDMPYSSQEALLADIIAIFTLE